MKTYRLCNTDDCYIVIGEFQAESFDAFVDDAAKQLGLTVEELQEQLGPLTEESCLVS